MSVPGGEQTRYKEAVCAQENCFFYDETDSTNLRAKEMARQGAVQGTAVFAGAQTAGRGRLSRTWLSEAGRGIYMSYIVRPNGVSAMRSPELSFLSGLAVCECFDEMLALAGSNERAALKWPNDVILGGKKACGILAETGLNAAGDIDWVVLGIGLNIFGTQFPEDLPWATSLEATAGAIPERGVISQKLLERLGYWINIWEKEGFSPVREACAKRMLTLNRRVRALRDGDAIEGTAAELCPDGSLLLVTDSGERIELCFGEVSVRGMMGYV